jgi:hypothetical protein
MALNYETLFAVGDRLSDMSVKIEEARKDFHPGQTEFWRLTGKLEMLLLLRDEMYATAREPDRHPLEAWEHGG